MVTWEDVEKLRDETYFRTKQNQVLTIDQAQDFVNSVGFCFAFTAKNSELPCLWHAAAGERKPAYPHHIQHDPYIGLVWQAKDDLAQSKKIYYGKAIKKRPSMISLEYFPSFYRLSRSSVFDDAYLADYMAGNLSSESKRIMDSLTENSPQITSDLKISSGFSNPKNRPIFDKAMAELQMKMYVVKIGEFYGPFTFLWDLVDRRFDEEIKDAKNLTRELAMQNILKKYFRTVLIAKQIDIERMFKWPKQELELALNALIKSEFISGNFVLEDIKGKFFILPELIFDHGNTEHTANK
jgi:hypothetical protein